MQGARGSGKTRTGAETLAYWMLHEEPGDWAIVAPTFADARDKCVEGLSGLQKVLGPAVETWNRSLGEMRLRTGARLVIDGGDDGALRIQGENLKGAWLDEVGLFKDWETTWDESISFAVRIDPARIIATGTPKGNFGLVKLLIADPDTIVTRTLLEDNEENLSEIQVRALRRRYEGTRLGRQELGGEILDDVEGALWSWQMIEDHRLAEFPEFRSRIAVAVDPAATASASADETGIVVVGLGGGVKWEGHAFVLADRSGHYSPDGWGRQAVGAYGEFEADRIVAERNQGGDMVEATIRTVDPNVPVRTVWASRGKQTRAEPVAALYEQGRVHHVGAFPELESEMCGWVPGEASPSRMDALVWALTELVLGGVQTPSFGQGESGEPSSSLTGDLLERKW